MSEKDGEIKGAVRQFIVRELLQGHDDPELTATTHLVDGGIVDSINVLRLVDFIEEAYDIMIEPTDIREFITIDRIGSIVHARMTGAPLNLN